MLSDHLREIRAKIEASPSRIVVIASRDHADNVPGSKHASMIKLPDGSRGWDHISFAYLDENGEIQFAEKSPLGGTLKSAFYNPNHSGTAAELVFDYAEIKVMAIDLTRYGDGAADRFIEATLEAIDRPYALTAAGWGDHCASAIGKGFAAAAGEPAPTAPPKPFFVWKPDSTTVMVNSLTGNIKYIPNHAFLQAKKHEVAVDWDPDRTYDPADESTADLAIPLKYRWAEWSPGSERDPDDIEGGMNLLGDKWKPQEKNLTPEKQLIDAGPGVPLDQVVFALRQYWPNLDPKLDAVLEMLQKKLVGTKVKIGGDGQLALDDAVEAIWQLPVPDGKKVFLDPKLDAVLNLREVHVALKEILPTGAVSVREYLNAMLVKAVAAVDASSGQPTEVASPQPATGWEAQPATGWEALNLASDNKAARTDGASQQPATGDEKEASGYRVALASDNKAARTDGASQQPATGDDQDASQERAALVSDTEDAATDGAGVMETAKAEAASVNSTGDADEAAAVPGQHATPASADMEQGFSFSMFAKQGIPVEFDKDTMPAEQVSPAADTTPAMPGSDTAHPDAGEDVGNAAPSKQPVVHHGDLAP